MIFKIVSLLIKLMEAHRMVTEVKKKGILFYLKILQGVRLGVIGALTFIFFFQLFVFCFIGLLGAGMFLSPLDLETKIWIVFGVCLGVVVLMTSMLCYLFSQKTWLKHSGVRELISK
jgi:hypothetical protein